MSDTPVKDKSKAPSPPPTVTISPVPELGPTEFQPAEPVQREFVPVPSSNGGDHGGVRLSPPSISDAQPRTSVRPFPTRPRINSIVNPATSSASPLAMLFQPIVVEEDAVAEDHEDTQGSAKPPNLLSYGPATRRRFVSIGPRRHGRTLTDSSPVASTLSRWRHHTRQSSHSPARSDEGDHFTRSPEPIRFNPSTSSVPETVGQVMEEEEREGGEPGLSRRLELMEDRQKRIEEMLVRLTENLS